jgi:predicted Mrr-cat superfamily restriction endonuclease
MLNEYREMLLDSAKEVYKVIKNPKCADKNKMLIASANTLAQTVKTAVQVEVLQYKAIMTAGNTTQLINKVMDDETYTMER